MTCRRHFWPPNASQVGNAQRRRNASNVLWERARPAPASWRPAGLQFWVHGLRDAALWDKRDVGWRFRVSPWP